MWSADGCECPGGRLRLGVSHATPQAASSIQPRNSYAKRRSVAEKAAIIYHESTTEPNLSFRNRNAGSSHLHRLPVSAVGASSWPSGPVPVICTGPWKTAAASRPGASREIIRTSVRTRDSSPPRTNYPWSSAASSELARSCRIQMPGSAGQGRRTHGPRGPRLFLDLRPGRPAQLEDRAGHALGPGRAGHADGPLLFSVRPAGLRQPARGLADGAVCGLYPFWIINTAELQDGVLATFALAVVLILGTQGKSVRRRPHRSGVSASAWRGWCWCGRRSCLFRWSP